MARKYEKISKIAKRVSFDESARYDFDAPRTSSDGRRSMQAPYHAPENNGEDSDDEIDNLLAEDPLYDEKESLRQRRGSRLSRKKRRAVIFGMITLTLGIVAAVVLVGLHTHAKVAASAQKAIEESAYADAMQEFKDLTEVPSLAGMLPLDDTPRPISPVPIDSTTSEGSLSDYETDQVISVPETEIDWNSEAEDKIAYEAEVAKAEADDSISDGPPELSAEAVSQAQGINAQLDTVSADVAALAEDSASKIEAHKGDPVQVVKDAAAEFWAWLDATWADLVGNSGEMDETIY